MPTIRYTRNFYFSASHRLNLDHLSADENQRLFGKCNNPYGHGHNYVLAISVEGPVRAETGLVIDPAGFEELVQREVLAVYDHRYLNHDLPQFSTQTATTENIATDIRDRLLAAWPPGFPALAHIRVQETKRNVIELPVIEEVV